MSHTRHQRHFEDLSPDDFERLAYWLVRRSGEFDEVQWYGGARDKGRDVVAYKHTPTGSEKWYIQAKRYQRITFATLRDELDKLAEHTQAELDFAPDVIVFATACAVPPQAKDQAEAHAQALGLPKPYYWGRLELDERLKAQPQTEAEFFGPDRRSRAEELHDYLDRAVAAYERRMYQLIARPAGPPDQPYKFLYPFEIEDANIFFGRDAAIEALHQTVLKDRLTVLHARSGAGKTSLLNAGLSPRLIREGRLPVYARAYDDPVRAIKRTIAPPSLAPWPHALAEMSLQEFLGQVCAHLSRQTQEMVVILDQFEEFFVFWPERDHRQPFIEALTDCYEDKGLPVRLIIGIRKDYYSDLADFQQRIPTVFYNEYRLEVMNHQEAKAAITGPVARLKRAVIYEPTLLDSLLDDLAQGEIELPYLQIVCTQLYERLAEGETTISLARYEALGRVEGVLNRYLQDVLAQLGGKGKDVAKAVLVELVSSKATRRVSSRQALARRVDANADELDRTLSQLVGARLLRQDEDGGKATYELAHEYLIEEITRWFDEEDRAFKQLEELLEREVATWRLYATLIPLDRLKMLYPNRDRFRCLDEETWHCLLRSALEADIAPEEWAGPIGELGERLLLEILGGAEHRLRLAATRTLGKIWKLPQVSNLGHRDRLLRVAACKAISKIEDPRAIEPLIAALDDRDRMVRLAVAEALGKTGNPRAVDPLIIALDDKDRVMQAAIARALGEIGDSRAVEPLIAALNGKDQRVQTAIARALGEIGDSRAVEPLIAALDGKDKRVQIAIAKALGKIGDSRAVEPLIAALRDRDKELRQAAAWALGMVGDGRAVDPLTTALGDKTVGEEAAQALVRIGGAPGVDSLAVMVEDDNVEMRREAVWLLGEIDDARVVDPLITALRDEYEEVWTEAVKALERLGRSAVEPLIAALASWEKDQRIRPVIVSALGKSRDGRVVEPLIAALKRGVLREEEAFGAFVGRGASVVEPLIAALWDEDGRVDSRIVSLLGQIGNPRAIEPLICALKDPDEWIHAEVVDSLTQIHDPRAVEHLAIIALTDPYASVRKRAALAPARIWSIPERADRSELAAIRAKVVRTLTEAGRNTVVKLLFEALASGEFYDESNILETLEEIGRHDVELLITALRDTNSSVRWGATRALEQIAEVSAVEPLIAVLRDDSEVVRESAAWALGQVGDVRSVEPLITLLRDDSEAVRESAAWALGQIGDVRSVDPLIATLGDENWGVYESVADALTRIGTPEALAALEEAGM